MKKFLAILVLSSLSHIANAATPTISNVSGTVATGQTLTITGTNMVNETKSGWDSNLTTYASNYGFEGTFGAAPFYQNSGNAFTPAYDSTVKLMGSKSLKWHVYGQTGCSPNCGASEMYTSPSGGTSDYYGRWYARFNAVNNIWPDNYVKQMGFQPSSGAITYLDIGGNNSGVEYFNGSSFSSSASFPFQNNRWYCFEVETHNSDKSFKLWIDNKLILTGASGVAISSNYNVFGIINYDTVNNTADLSEWWDNFAYGETSRIYPSSTIEISGDGGSTWKWQPPTSLSDTTIAVTAELPTLTVANYFLRVTNNLQQTSSTYNMSGGGGGGGSSLNGACGSAYGQSFTSLTSASSNLCSSGNVASFSGSGPWTWGCNGSGGGTSTSSAACTASLSVTPVNGACGSANGQSFTALTSGSSNLCSSGTVASFTGSGPWTWGCNGSGGGTSTSNTGCSANLSSSGTSLLSESFDDANFGTRGWYDAYPASVASSGCYSGSCAQFSFAQGGTTPTQLPSGAMRKQFTATDSLYVSFYIKFATGWEGSQKAYHPHMISILSDVDDAANQYTPLANNYLNTYIEFLSDIGSPYAIRPQLDLQDELNVNTSNGTLPNNLTAVTENRSVNYCNTPVSSGASGQCYADITYYSANVWKDSTHSLSTNTWHFVEAYFKMNSISGGKGQHDGIMQEWIDGAQVINQSDVLYRTNQHPTMKWRQFVFAPYIGDGAPVAETFYIDNLQLYNSLPSGSSFNAVGGVSVKSVTNP